VVRAAAETAGIALIGIALGFPATEADYRFLKKLPSEIERGDPRSGMWPGL
jgi:hypothetical protein